MNSARLLIVDDEPQIVRALRPALVAAGYQVDAVGTAQEALAATQVQPFDLIILDLGLPDLDGKDFMVRARQHTKCPVIVLSARHGEEEKIAALDLGASDYVSKPFSIGELMARLRVVLRSHSADDPLRNGVMAGDLSVDFDSRRIRVRGREMKLSPREGKLLHALAQKTGQVLTHAEIVAAVWGAGAQVDAQFVRVLVGNLRQKVEKDPARPSLIITEQGLGYRLRSVS